MVKVTVHGVSDVQNLFRDIEHELRQSEMKIILNGAARAVVKASRKFVPQTGEIGSLAKRDIGIVKSRVIKNQAEVNVGMMFKFSNINDQVQKVAPIIQHMTEGFKQTDRKKRGRVKKRGGDFIEEGFLASSNEQMAEINTGIEKKIARIKSKQ